MTSQALNMTSLPTVYTSGSQTGDKILRRVTRNKNHNVVLYYNWLLFYEAKY